MPRERVPPLLGPGPELEVLARRGQPALERALRPQHWLLHRRRVEWRVPEQVLVAALIEDRSCHNIPVEVVWLMALMMMMNLVMMMMMKAATAR